ncbi:coiled-coil domain-containing protein 167 [Arapaima gigas]
MAKPKEKKKEKISVASEIDRIEERRSLCQDNLDKAEYKWCRGQLSEKERKLLEEEMTIMKERIQKYEQELAVLRLENRRNMMLSIALLVLTALFYYAFVA